MSRRAEASAPESAMTDGRRRLVWTATAGLVLAALGVWLWRSDSHVLPGAPPPQADAFDASTRTASAAPPAAPAERTEASVPLRSVPDLGGDLAHVRGRCVDASGRPLADCTAKLSGAPGAANPMAVPGEVEWKDPEPFVTGADGRFDIAFAPPSGLQFTLDVQADGRVPRTGRWGRIEPAKTIDLGDIPMAAGFEVRGRVVDEQGAPVAGVGVRLKNLPLPLAHNMGANHTRFGSSAADGTFRMDVPIPVGTWSVDVQSPGMRALSPDGVTVGADGAGPVLVTVQRRPTIEGSVVDERGLPVAGVALAADLNRYSPTSAWSRADGTFVLYAVDAEPTPVRLLVRDPGPCEPPRSDPRLWEWGSSDVRFVLKRALTFELTVVERQTGAPVTHYAVSCASAYVRAGPRNDPRLGGEHQAGRVTVDRVWRGKNVLQVIPLDPALRPSLSVEFEASDAGVAPMRVEVDRLQRATVRAMSPGGEPVAGSKIEVVVTGSQAFDASAVVQDSRTGDRDSSSDPDRRFHERIGMAVTGVDGRVEVFVPSDAGGLVLRVTGQHPPLVVDPVAFAAGQDLVVVVPEGGSIVGKVVLHGLDPSHIAVHPRLTGGREFRRRSYDEGTLRADGSFALRGLAPGGYQLRLSYVLPFRTERGVSESSANLDLNVPEVRVSAGRDTEVEIDAAALAPATLRGRLRVNGAVPSFVRVVVRAARGPQFGLVGMFVPDADGVFEATGLLPGTYRAILVVGDFRAGHDDFIVSEDTFMLAAGERLVRDFAFTRRRLVVTILQADGKTPAAGLQVAANGTDLNKVVTSNDKGVLVIDPAPAGLIDLQAVGGGQLDAVEVPAGEIEHSITLTLPPPPRGK